MKAKYGDIKRTQRFKHSGGILTPNKNEKVEIEERQRKMETAFRLCQETCNSKCLSYPIKLKSDTTVRQSNLRGRHDRQK